MAMGVQYVAWQAAGQEAPLPPCQSKKVIYFDFRHVSAPRLRLCWHHQAREKESAPMKLPAEIGEQPINQTIERHPRIGEILNQYDIGCVTCGVGICLVKDVVAIHALGVEIEEKIEQEINDYINTLTTNQ
jgi:hypothetical protein